MMAVIVLTKHSVLQNFARTAVTAYECGYSEDTLRQELEQATAQQSTPDSVKVLLHWHLLVSLLCSYTLYLLQQYKPCIHVHVSVDLIPAHTHHEDTL